MTAKPGHKGNRSFDFRKYGFLIFLFEADLSYGYVLIIEMRCTLQRQLPVRMKSGTSTGWLCKGLLLQIVHFHEPNAGGVVHTADTRCVVTGWQRRNDR